MSAPTDPEVPQAVTFREIREILRTFRDSGWTGMTIDLHGMRITVGKDGPPRGPAGSPAAPVAASAPAAVAAGNGTGDRRDGPDGRSSAAVASAPAGAGAAPPVGDPGVDLAGTVEVHSPAVGAFWVAPGPGQPPFVAVGQAVAQDEQLAIVEVMKLMNPVVAPVAGTVVQVCAVNADLVEYEQVLFRIRPDGG